ncbi:SIR2 family protein [Staphylococcus sp. NRL 18/288]|nr:SIR2 family protein [Staphylococcus sp. NRL 18/288]
MHGTPKSKPEYFVSSASSYNYIYLEENPRLDLMRTLFKKEKSYTMIFIGCSLEEEEIINLLSKKVQNIKLYALMKKNDNEDFNKFVKDYYYEKYNINIIWYGKKHNELPLFLEELVNEIQQKKKLYSYEKVYEALTNEEEESINIINNVIDNGDYSKLNRSIKKTLSRNSKIQKKQLII